MASYHTVTTGDSIASIAKQYGFFAPDIWDHPNNADLKELRDGNPNTLLSGDLVYIPDLVPKSFDIETEKRHRYRRLGIPSKITFQVLEFGKPLVGIAYTITLDDKSEIKGNTDGDGFIRESVQPERKWALVEYEGRFGPKKKKVSLGHLDPISTTSGVQQRLKNLGYDLEATGEEDEKTAHALMRFQRKQQLEQSGSIDDATRDKLVEVCGS